MCRMVTRMTQPKESTLPDVKWLTVPEVATYLCCSRMTIYRAVRSGVLPAIKFGGKAGNFRIAESALLTFIRDAAE